MFCVSSSASSSVSFVLLCFPGGDHGPGDVFCSLYQSPVPLSSTELPMFMCVPPSMSGCCVCKMEVAAACTASPGFASSCRACIFFPLSLFIISASACGVTLPHPVHVHHVVASKGPRSCASTAASAMYLVELRCSAIFTVSPWITPTSSLTQDMSVCNVAMTFSKDASFAMMASFAPSMPAFLPLLALVTPSNATTASSM